WPCSRRTKSSPTCGSPCPAKRHLRDSGASRCERLSGRIECPRGCWVTLMTRPPCASNILTPFIMSLVGSLIGSGQINHLKCYGNDEKNDRFIALECCF